MKYTCDMCLQSSLEPLTTHRDGCFCDFCLQEGTLLYATDDLHTFRQRYFKKLYAEGANEFVARFHVLLIGQAPYWRKRRY